MPPKKWSSKGETSGSLPKGPKPVKTVSFKMGVDSYVSLLRNFRNACEYRRLYGFRVTYPKPHSFDSKDYPNLVQLIDLDVENLNSHKIIFRTLAHSVYGIGAQNKDTQSWQHLTGGEEPYHSLVPLNARKLGGESYGQMGGLRDTNCGWWALDNAISFLCKSNADKNETLKQFKVLCIMFCEAARFSIVARFTCPLMEEQVNKVFPTTLEDIITDWGNSTRKMIEKGQGLVSKVGLTAEQQIFQDSSDLDAGSEEKDGDGDEVKFRKLQRNSELKMFLGSVADLLEGNSSR